MTRFAALTIVLHCEAVNVRHRGCININNLTRELEMFFFFSNRLGCLGSIVVSLVGTAVVVVLVRSC